MRLDIFQLLKLIVFSSEILQVAFLISQKQSAQSLGTCLCRDFQAFVAITMLRKVSFRFGNEQFLEEADSLLNVKELFVVFVLLLDSCIRKGVFLIQIYGFLYAKFLIKDRRVGILNLNTRLKLLKVRQISLAVIINVITLLRAGFSYAIEKSQAFLLQPRSYFCLLEDNNE